MLAMEEVKSSSDSPISEVASTTTTTVMTPTTTISTATNPSDNLTLSQGLHKMIRESIDSTFESYGLIIGHDQLKNSIQQSMVEKITNQLKHHQQLQQQHDQRQSTESTTTYGSL